jgi:hypothetical protein
MTGDDTHHQWSLVEILIRAYRFATDIQKGNA